MKRGFVLLVVFILTATLGLKKSFGYEYQFKFHEGPDSPYAMVQGGASSNKIVTIPDPEPIRDINRFFFQVNDKLYFYLLKPVARIYSIPLPLKARVSIKNIIHNANVPIRFLNCLLQGKIVGSFTELARFIINSTLGLGGAVDVASDMGLKEHEEDFGQTLGVYGMKEISYLDLPLAGPSCVRDLIGMVADMFSNPLYYISPGAYFVVNLVKRVNNTSLTIGDYEELKKEALDPYVALRNAYFQYRLELIKR